MAKIVIRLHGQEITALTLEDGQEYIAGRAEDSSIVLPNQKGISRHHIKFYQRDGIWVVQLLARFGALMHGGKAQDVIELKEDCGFSAHPFEFIFTLVEAKLVKAATPDPADDQVELDDKSALMPAIGTSLTPVSQPDEMTSSPKEPEGNSDATIAGKNPVMPFLRISSKSSKREDILRLEGMVWVAGRDTNCEIHVDDGKASRRHFEITRTVEGFFITDLNSANGTHLNEEQLPPNEPWQLASGDSIRVSGVKLVFEVRDVGFNSRVPAILPAVHKPQQMQDPGFGQDPGAQGYNIPAPYIEPGMAGDFGYGAAVVKVQPPKGLVANLTKNKPRMILMVLVPLLLFKLFTDGTDPATPPVDPDKAENSSSSPTFDQLSEEKKRWVKDSFNLSKTMYMQGKFSLCLAELTKLHDVVPAYDNSTELQVFCKQGHDLTLKQQDADRKEREKTEAVRFITQVVEDCRRQMDKSTTLDDVRICLSPAIERDPENQALLDLQSQVQMNQSERERKQQDKVNAVAHRDAGERQFQKAKALFKAGELTKALSAYQKFLDGGYPELETQRSEAQRDVAQARKELDAKVSGLLATCRENLDKSQFKAAYLSCDKVLKENAGNPEAAKMKATALSELRRELKSMYEDSVLEESMGNIDSAKDRWKQILEKSVPGDEYFNKSRRNLQKYGVGT